MEMEVGRAIEQCWCRHGSRHRKSLRDTQSSPGTCVHDLIFLFFRNIFLFPLICFVVVIVVYFETEPHVAKDGLQLPRPDLEPLLFLLPLPLPLYQDYRNEPPHSDYSLAFVVFVLTVSLISRENPVRGSRV